ncbi:sugar MFS transporter [Sphingobacterium sp. SGG-5]|nr:sugar MFS transporter [Sphingobacterium sp. SGG-5]
MQRSNFLVGVILVIWFVISFVTNIMGPLMPIVIETYKLNLTMAAFLPFSFFLAYGVMSIPAGIMTERLGGKRAMLIAFALNFIGALAIVLYPVYAVALASLFIIGIGMAMLQVIINPLMRVAGGEEHFAFYSVLAQLIFGAGSFVSPFVFTYMMEGLSSPVQGNGFLNLFSSLVNGDMHWTALYGLFTMIFVLIFVLLFTIKIPKVELKDDEKSGTGAVYLDLLKDKKVILFFFGIVAYVGTEQAIANWMSQFLKQYHNIDPTTQGATAIAWFWGLMSIGCLLGLVFLKLFDSKWVLKTAAVLALTAISLALFGSSAVSYYAFMTCGFTISVMFSIIFSLALNSISAHHGSFSGILCSGIFGGALVPLLVGALGDWVGLRYAMIILYATVGYILYLAYYAQPLIANKTVKLKELFKL